MRLFSIVLTIVVIMCSCKNEVHKNSWYTGLPSDWRKVKWDKISKENIYTVNAAYRSEAIQKLENASFAKISQDKISSLISGQPQIKFPCFLVRSIVFPSNKTGKIVAYQNSVGDIVILFGMLGSAVGEMEKEPIIIQLTKSPKQIYVAYQCAK